MDPSNLLVRSQVHWLPRPCGDGPQLIERMTAFPQVTPPMRGWTLVDSNHGNGKRGYPAHAGMDLSLCPG